MHCTNLHACAWLDSNDNHGVRLNHFWKKAYLCGEARLPCLLQHQCFCSFRTPGYKAPHVVMDIDNPGVEAFTCMSYTPLELSTVILVTA